jgi:hypothetical protein
MKINNYILSLMALTTVFYSCKDKTKTPQPNILENETITTIKLILTDSSNTTQKLVFSYQDLNQNDTAKGIYTIPELEANKTYFGEIVLLDETKIPQDTVSNEIKKLKDEHQFVYKSSNANSVISYLPSDVDSKGYFVGLYPTIKTGNISNANFNLSVDLYHLPTNKLGDTNENIANGSVDVSVIFNNIHIK